MRLSPHNRRVARLRRLTRDPDARRSEGVFVAEGPKLLAAALDAGAPLEGLYVAPGAPGDLVGRATADSVPVYQLDPDVLRRVADSVTPQPVLAVVRRIDVPLDAVADGDPLVACVDLRDPGNLGAILRTAEATGIGAVICCAGTVDVYNPKCVRASAGALFRLPLVAGGEPEPVLEMLGRWGHRRLAAQAAGGLPPERCDLRRPTAIVLGNEGHGLPPALGSLVDERVTIPMAGAVESLNVSIAAAVLCFEVARQRRAAAE
ncbi:MAG: RNA methyltransferase [Actinomycetota bacterium]|nr:RNA methyltransferase [Actinomycetota bacterium]